jgi:adenosylhomocysteine nucleosidase
VLVTYDAADRPITVLFAMASEPELGPALRALISPLITGIGPVEAASAVAETLAALAATGQRPDLIVAMGSAGSNRLPQAEIFQVSTARYRDMDASPLGFEKGVTPFSGCPAELTVAQRLPGIAKATISTGGAIVNGPTYTTIGADMADMETFAMMRAAWRAGVPVITLRGVSDGVEPLERFADWTRYLAEIDEKLAAIIAGLDEALAQRPAHYWRRVEGRNEDPAIEA